MVVAAGEGSIRGGPNSAKFCLANFNKLHLYLVVSCLFKMPYYVKAFDVEVFLDRSARIPPIGGD
jgi:hypothetical protein